MKVQLGAQDIHVYPMALHKTITDGNKTIPMLKAVPSLPKASCLERNRISRHTKQICVVTPSFLLIAMNNPSEGIVS